MWVLARPLSSYVCWIAKQTKVWSKLLYFPTVYQIYFLIYTYGLLIYLWWMTLNVSKILVFDYTIWEYLIFLYISSETSSYIKAPPKNAKTPFQPGRPSKDDCTINKRDCGWLGYFVGPSSFRPSRLLFYPFKPLTLHRREQRIRGKGVTSALSFLGQV